MKVTYLGNPIEYDPIERSRQYKELSMSKNREPFRLFVRRKGEKGYWGAMEFQSPSYLCERGDEYKRLGMIEHYYVSNVKEPF